MVDEISLIMPSKVSILPCPWASCHTKDISRSSFGWQFVWKPGIKCYEIFLRMIKYRGNARTSSYFCFDDPRFTRVGGEFRRSLKSQGKREVGGQEILPGNVHSPSGNFVRADESPPCLWSSLFLAVVYLFSH